jgi:hypothetical protein
MRDRSSAALVTLFLALLFVSAWPSQASAQWTALTNPAPAFLDQCNLLTDGTVVCHEYSSNRWRRLTPDINGSYRNGTWSSIANMPDGVDPSFGCNPCTYRPLYFASAVLADGRLVVIGGEYNPVGTAVWTNIGFIYDPATNSWSSQLAEVFGGGNIGDAQAIVLADGTFVLTNITNGNIEALDATTLTFTALNPPGKDDQNNEENWNLLPDGTILTVDAHINSSFEIYDPISNQWLPAGATPVNMADCCGAADGVGNSREVGPGVLRPDGTLIYFSGNSLGQNAVYDTATGTWSHAAGMDFPLVPMQTYHYAVADGPASLLPNGNVLVQASPVINGSPFNTPSHFFEWDGTSLTQVGDSPNAAAFKAYQGRMLLLPTGEVLLAAYNQHADGAPDIQDVVLYTNGGSPQDAWRPVITSSPDQVTPGSTYPISGTLFTGFSEGAMYGDDSQASTNYPLVRITNIGTGHVFYARTHGHSRMGVVAVGDPTVVTTNFDAPAGMEAGPSELVVVVNGIPSVAVIINRTPTTTTVDAATGDYHDGVTLRATVEPAGVTGTVEFFVDGASIGLGAYNSATGVATINYLITQAAGTYDLRADFTSTSPTYADSTDTLGDGLTVTLEESTTTYTGPTVIANGGPVTLTATFEEDGANDDDGEGGAGIPVAGRTIHFQLGTGVTAQTCDGVSDIFGVASCTINPVNQPLGPGVVSASFTSDGFYRDSSDDEATMVFAFPEFGGFAIGDLNSAVGTSVTFWDAQWSNLNSLSGGSAPSAFKGFGDTLSAPPACGITLTGTPGNSTHPPATVPAFMGVLVPTSVTRSGSNYSAVVWSIVVVQTNAGYAGNPGHAGTGTVVAQVCHP